jgi:hypothetical protein
MHDTFQHAFSKRLTEGMLRHSSQAASVGTLVCFNQISR